MIKNSMEFYNGYRIFEEDEQDNHWQETVVK